MNSVNLIGRIVNDLELKHTPNGKAVLNFSIAVKRDKDTTDFLDLVAWGTVAENISRYLNKGSQIGVDGSLQTRMYEYNGQKRKTTEVKVDKFDFIGSKSENGGNENSFAPPVTPKFEEIDTDDTLPF